jgi:hypothetical protein
LGWFFGYDFGDQAGQDQDKKQAQMVEDEAEIVSGGGEESIDCVACGTEQVISVEPPVIFHVTDHGLDSGSSLEFALDSWG